jgi:hypothetical protein
MSLKNLISIEFSANEEVELQKALETIQRVLKGKTINLTPAERQQYGSIGEYNKLLVEKVRMYLNQNTDLQPRGFDLVEFDKDYKARQICINLLSLLTNITEQVEDTKVLLDHDNYSDSLKVYRHVRYLADEGEPGLESIYEDLKQLFSKTSNKSE